jgi:hypothetical protein
MYEGEQTQQEAKIAKMKEEGVDEYDVRKQEEVLAETVMMIPERRTALESASQDLTDLLVRRAHPAAPPTHPVVSPHLHLWSAGRGGGSGARRVRGDYGCEGLPR